MSGEQASGDDVAAEAETEEPVLPPGPGPRSANGSNRRRHRKVRTGCDTWIRRVKCDEGKPTCMKCRSTGRRCDGYSGTVAPVAGTHTRLAPSHPHAGNGSGSRLSFEQNMASLSIRNRLLDFPGSVDEHRSIDFFYRQTAPILSGYFDANFWTDMLPRIGCAEPCIQHAMIAVASLQEHSASEELLMTPQNSNFRFALTQYNKSIKLLNQRLLAESNPTIALISCVLFVCIEYLRGNLDGAASHVDGGLSVLRAPKSGNSTPDLLTQTKSIEASLTEIFLRLSIQNSLCGRAWSPMVADRNGQTDQTPLAFTTLLEARNQITLLMHSAHGFIRSCLPLKLIPGTPPLHGSVEKRDALLAELHRWKSNMDTICEKTKANYTRSEVRASTTLSVLYLISKIWISTSMEIEEKAWDNHVEDFERILSLSESLNGREAGDGSTSTTFMAPRLAERYTWRDQFTFEMGAMPAVYFTAVKCRYPAVRRRAIAILRMMRPRREGLWDARQLIVVASRVIEVEEAKAVPCEHPEPGLPAETSRVLDARFGNGYYNGRREQEVTFISRPEGLDRGLTEWTEYIKW